MGCDILTAEEKEACAVELTKVQKLARVLRVMVIVVLVCNILALLFVPGYVTCYAYQFEWESVFDTFAYDFDDGLAIFFDGGYKIVWDDPYTAVLTLFLWACGGCTAVILWQAKRVLEGIVKAETFTHTNAANMRRAAVCCFGISGAALARTVWGICYYRSVMPILTYNFLFVPVFLIAGLVCLVMSALFRQAAEMKTEQDLTI